MPGIRIVTDSACDLPPATATEHNIDIVPLSIRFGDNEYVDRKDLTPKEFWAKNAEAKQLPETAAPSPGAFEECFRAAAAQGATGLCVSHLSSGLSATFQSATLAAEAVKDTIAVRVIDSRTVTIAQGLMAIAAAQAAAAGKSLDEVTALVEAKVPHMRVFAALDTLENLRKGGRIGAAKAAFGSMLSVKPLIRVDRRRRQREGQGTHARPLARRTDRTGQAARRGPGEPARCHARRSCPTSISSSISLATGLGIEKESILLGDVGAVIGTHTGPGVIGIAWEETPRVIT